MGRRVLQIYSDRIATVTIARQVEETARGVGLGVYFAVEGGQTRRLGGTAAIVTALWRKMNKSWSKPYKIIAEKHCNAQISKARRTSIPTL